MSLPKLVGVIDAFVSLRVANFDTARVEALMANPKEVEIFNDNDLIRDALPLLLEKLKVRRVAYSVEC